MATAAVIGGGMLLGGIASGIGASKQAQGQVDAANIQATSAASALAASQAQQGIGNERADINFTNSQTQFDQSQLATNAQLGLLGVGGDPNAAQNILNSPLVASINAQNQQNIDARSAASGVSGGNLLTALQNANTSTILQAGFGGLGQIAGNQQQGSLGFGGLGNQSLGLANQSLGMANQAQFNQGNALGNAAIAQGNQNAIPSLTGANLLNQGTQLAGFGLGGGFGAPQGTATPNPFGTPLALPTPALPPPAPVGSGSNRFSGTTAGFVL